MLDIQKVRNDFPILDQKVYGKPLVILIMRQHPKLLNASSIRSRTGMKELMQTFTGVFIF